MGKDGFPWFCIARSRPALLREVKLNLFYENQGVTMILKMALVLFLSVNVGVENFGVCGITIIYS